MKDSTVHTHAGEKHSKLLLIEFVRINGLGYYKCVCDCGKTNTIRWNNIDSGVTKSCGCLASSRARKHGESNNSKEYRAWAQMRDRCNNKNCTNYKNYGGRGIKICKRWNVYLNFLKDMGRAPSIKHSLDRIRVNCGYKPSNCRWATQQEQENNRRNNKFITIDGVKKTIAEWARFKNIPYHKFYNSPEIIELRKITQ